MKADSTLGLSRADPTAVILLRDDFVASCNSINKNDSIIPTSCYYQQIIFSFNLLSKCLQFFQCSVAVITCLTYQNFLGNTGGICLLGVMFSRWEKGKVKISRWLTFVIVWWKLGWGGGHDNCYLKK